MTLFDHAVLTIVGLSIMLGVVRGFVREVLALGGWVASGWLSGDRSFDAPRLRIASVTPCCR